MKVSDNLVRASRIMAWLSILGAVLGPAVLIACFVWPEFGVAIDAHFNHLGVPLTEATPLIWRLGAMLCALVPTAIASWGLIALAGLFRCFIAGEVFSAQSLRALSHVTAALFWNVLAAFVMQAPISALLSYPLGPHHREISLGLGTDDVQVLFVAGVAYVLARVMAEARRIADENEGFV